MPEWFDSKTNKNGGCVLPGCSVNCVGTNKYNIHIHILKPTIVLHSHGLYTYTRIRSCSPCRQALFSNIFSFVPVLFARFFCSFLLR